MPSCNLNSEMVKEGGAWVQSSRRKQPTMAMRRLKAAASSFFLSLPPTLIFPDRPTVQRMGWDGFCTPARHCHSVFPRPNETDSLYSTLYMMTQALSCQLQAYPSDPQSSRTSKPQVSCAWTYTSVRNFHCDRRIPFFAGDSTRFKREFNPRTIFFNISWAQADSRAPLSLKVRRSSQVFFSSQSIFSPFMRLRLVESSGSAIST